MAMGNHESENGNEHAGAVCEHRVNWLEAGRQAGHKCPALAWLSPASGAIWRGGAGDQSEARGWYCTRIESTCWSGSDAYPRIAITYSVQV
jgi:hypothetical protein